MNRILFVDHVAHLLGGAEVNLIELLPRLPPGSSLCACPPGGPLATALARHRIPLVPYELPSPMARLRVVGRKPSPWDWYRGWRGVKAARRRLAEIIRESRPSVVVTCTNKDHLVAAPLIREGRARGIWWINDAWTADFFPGPVRWFLTRAARQSGARLVAVSGFVKDSLVRAGISANRLHVVHNGVSLDRYLPARPPHEGFPVVGFVGRLTPWKGPDLFLDLAEILLARGVQARFALLGEPGPADADYVNHLKARSSQGVLQGRVDWLGFHEEVVPVLRDWRVLVHCSRKPEPFGRVLIEAMACGVPPVAFGRGGVPEIVKSGLTGWVVPPGPISALADPVATLLKSPERAREMGLAGREHVRRVFSLERVASDWERVLREASA